MRNIEDLPKRCPFFWRARAAWQTWGMMRLMKLYMKLRYLSPEARNLTVMTSFKPGCNAVLIWVTCFSILSTPTHQTWQAPSWGSWRRTVGLLLWALPSVWRNVVTASLSLISSWFSPVFRPFTSLSSRCCWKTATLSKTTLTIRSAGWAEAAQNVYPIGDHSGSIQSVHLTYILSIRAAFFVNSGCLDLRHLPTRHQA